MLKKEYSISIVKYDLNPHAYFGRLCVTSREDQSELAEDCAFAVFVPSLNNTK
jgi:hypothetical protein